MVGTTNILRYVRNKSMNKLKTEMFPLQKPCQSEIVDSRERHLG